MHCMQDAAGLSGPASFNEQLPSHLTAQQLLQRSCQGPCLAVECHPAALLSSLTPPLEWPKCNHAGPAAWHKSSPPDPPALRLQPHYPNALQSPYAAIKGFSAQSPYAATKGLSALSPYAAITGRSAPKYAPAAADCANLPPCSPLQTPTSTALMLSRTLQHHF